MERGPLRQETIAAIATPPGRGGVAILRLSGPQAVEIADRLFSGPIPSFASHTVHRGTIRDPSGKRIDEGLALPMLAPRSYTGEDVVELHCHGGWLLSRRVLEAALRAGASAAGPGEFTFRAYMNGKLDLAQAEAVQELIAAKNERALDAAESQLQGLLSRQIRSYQQELTQAAAILEAWIDFPEEDLEFASFEELISRLEEIKREMQRLLDTFHEGKMIHEGISLCLAGRPNVGKSSLMNALLKKERAIVSEMPGTTRDLLEDHLLLNGLNFKLIDTAGIREAEELVEREGVRRSRAAMREADLILLVLDLSAPLQKEDEALLEEVPKEKTLLIWNKRDLSSLIPPETPFPHSVAASALTGEGLQELAEEIDRIIWKEGPPSKDEAILTQARHHEALSEALSFCQAAISGLEKRASPEFVSFDMRLCLKALGSIIGTDVTEDILSSVFSQFCIGK